MLNGGLKAESSFSPVGAFLDWRNSLIGYIDVVVKPDVLKSLASSYFFSSTFPLFFSATRNAWKFSHFGSTFALRYPEGPFTKFLHLDNYLSPYEPSGTTLVCTKQTQHCQQTTSTTIYRIKTIGSCKLFRRTAVGSIAFLPRVK